MSAIARRLTGMTEKELREYNFPSVKSIRDVFGATHKDVRIFAGLIIGPEDLDKKRKELRNNIPKALL